jgi:hypothetical protein
MYHRSCTHSLTTKVQESAVAEVKKELMARIKELEAVIAEQEHAQKVAVKSEGGGKEGQW